ncbi:MAG TPA: twin-arginine translocase TatA/TatE family subunit [Chloroflexota bacterium]
MGFAGHLPELVIILVAALVIFGPKRLPEIGNAMGKSIKEFKKGVEDSHQPDELPSKDVRLPEREPVAARPEPAATAAATERPTPTPQEPKPE